MAQLLMPKATGIWLIDNTALTFDQIADFTGLHSLEIKALADGEVSPGMTGMDPIQGGQLTADEIKRCEADTKARLRLRQTDLPQPVARAKGPRYTPVSKRADKPNAIAWFLKHHPELSDKQISRLIGTTKDTIDRVKNRTHWNSANIKADNPVHLGLCSNNELQEELKNAQPNPDAQSIDVSVEDKVETEKQDPFAVFKNFGTGGSED